MHVLSAGVILRNFFMKNANILQKKRRLLKLSGDASSVPWRLLGVLSLASLGLGMIAIIQPFGPVIYMYIYAGSAILYPAWIAFLCVKDSFKNGSFFNVSTISQRSGRRFSPLLLGLNVCVFALAQIVFLLYFLIKHTEEDFPSFPYYLMFGIYPFLISAILLLPARGISPLTRLKILLDSLIIITAIATLCFYFVLAPMLMWEEGTLAEKVTGVLFPSADLIVMFCLLLVVLRSGEPALRPVLGLLGLAFLCIFLIHINRLSEVLGDTFHWVEPASVAWAPALMFVAGAAQTMQNILKKDEVVGHAVVGPAEMVEVSSPTSRWKSLLAVNLVLVVSLVVFVLWLGGVEKIFRGQIAVIYVGGFALLMLIILRQLLAVCEISVLQGKLRKRNRALSLLNDLLEKQATTDSLTGLPNHHELMATLNEALEYAQQTTTPCAVVFMDIDHFKAVNDCYGHLVGDAVLSEFSELVLSEMRDGEYLGRWGGEEFVAVLPGVEADGAFQVAERIRVAVEQHVFADEQEVHLTCSLGTATYPYVATRREDLLVNADRAMYTAKRLGRNQTRMAIEPLVLALGMLAEEPETADEAEMLAVVESFIGALEARDPLTAQHSRRVATLALKLALILGLNWSEACIIGMGGLLHDLGKVAMPDAILFKHGKLSAAEIEYMARHPLIGEKILTPLPSLRKVALIVRTHHEWIDGSGYPDGLRGDNIPLGARIVAVSDAYDAIISHRVYRQGRASSEAIAELRKGAGKQFDLRVVEALDYLIATSPRLSVISAT